MKDTAPKIHEKGNLLFTRKVKKGKIDKAFENCQAVVEKTYQTSQLEHSYLEPDAGAGYVDDDEYADFIIGARLNAGGGWKRGRAYVFSGEDGDTLWTFSGEADNHNLGWSVSGAGDIDADGYDDLIVGSRGAEKIYVHSGLTGDTLFTYAGEAGGDKFGYSVSGAGDVDDDGYADVIVGAYRNPKLKFLL